MICLTSLLHSTFKSTDPRYTNDHERKTFLTPRGPVFLRWLRSWNLRAYSTSRNLQKGWNPKSHVKNPEPHEMKPPHVNVFDPIWAGDVLRLTFEMQLFSPSHPYQSWIVGTQMLDGTAIFTLPSHWFPKTANISSLSWGCSQCQCRIGAPNPMRHSPDEAAYLGMLTACQDIVDRLHGDVAGWWRDGWPPGMECWSLLFWRKTKAT